MQLRAPRWPHSINESTCTPAINLESGNHGTRPALTVAGGKLLVSAPFLLGVFDSIYVLCLSAWVGSILFFSFGVAPIIFKELGSESGGKFVRALFPRYYAWGAVAGAIALPAFVAVPLCYPEYRGKGIAIQAMMILAGTLIMLYGGNSLTPAINTARDSGAVNHDRFERLHRRSVRLNTLALVIGLGLLISFANRPAPRTTGIEELSPTDRGRFDNQLNQVIEEVEAKYGYRTGRGVDAGSTVKSDPSIDPETVKELESYYEQKKRRDLRAQRGPGLPDEVRSNPSKPRTGNRATTPESGNRQGK